MHSEHDLKERSDAQIIVSRFPCGAQPFYTTLGTKGRRPDGCHMPLCAAGAGPFGNTASHRFFTKAHGFPAAAGGIGIYMMAPKAPYLASAAILYTSRGREPSTRPGGVSRSRTEPLAPRARSPAAPSTLARESRRQPSGIPASTAQIPVPTAPQAHYFINSPMCRLISPAIICLAFQSPWIPSMASSPGMTG